MKVLVIGGGGREHALCWALSRDPTVSEIVAAPGNPGIGAVARLAPIGGDDLEGIVVVANRERPDLVVIGPEAPLVAGLADRLRTDGHFVFGPSSAAASIEGSKAFAKELMASAAIPTARAVSFSSVNEAMSFVDELGGRAVVKADGLAAGKGVVVAHDRQAARDALIACLDQRVFGDSGAITVVEEVLDGPEVSAFALTDGSRVLPLGLAQDFKRARNGDEGPNTGGMGAYSPVRWVGEPIETSIWKEIAEPAIAEMASRGMPFSGVLFAGLMLTEDGPKVLEFNCRFGDPETEALLPRIGSGFADALSRCATGDLTGATVDMSRDACVTVVITSGGYPGAYRTGFVIDGLGDAEKLEGVHIFHSGTAQRDGRVVTAGGRVLAVSALAGSLTEARRSAYRAVELIRFEGKTIRTDIAEVAEGEAS